MDSALSSTEALTSSSDDYEFLAELTRQMVYHTLLEQDDENDKKPDSVPDVRTSKGCESYFPPERAPKQMNPAKRRTRSGLIHGECYVGLSLPQQQKFYPLHMAGFGTRAVVLDSRTGSKGTGVFLPRTAGNPSDRAQRKPRSSTVLIPARVAQALLVHFSKRNPQGGSVSLQPGASGRCGVGVGPFLQKGQPEEPCRTGLTDTWHFHPLPSKVEEKMLRRPHIPPFKQMSSVVSNKEEIIGNEVAPSWAKQIMMK